MSLPAHIEIVLELSATAFTELHQKLVAAELTDRIFVHEGQTHLDYDTLRLRKLADGGDVTPETWDETLAAFVALGFYDRWSWDPEETETDPGARVVSMDIAAVKQQA